MSKIQLDNALLLTTLKTNTLNEIKYKYDSTMGVLIAESDFIQTALSKTGIDENDSGSMLYQMKKVQSILKTTQLFCMNS